MGIKIRLGIKSYTLWNIYSLIQFTQIYTFVVSSPVIHFLRIGFTIPLINCIWSKLIDYICNWPMQFHPTFYIGQHRASIIGCCNVGSSVLEMYSGLEKEVLSSKCQQRVLLQCLTLMHISLFSFYSNQQANLLFYYYLIDLNFYSQF